MPVVSFSSLLPPSSSHPPLVSFLSWVQRVDFSIYEALMLMDIIIGPYRAFLPLVSEF